MNVGETAYEFENRQIRCSGDRCQRCRKDNQSVGKLAGQLKDQGKKVILAAADTVPCGSRIEQLTEWAHRAGVDIIAQQEGSDPAAVIYDADRSMQKPRNADVLLCDTAGRLHNKKESDGRAWRRSTA